MENKIIKLKELIDKPISGEWGEEVKGEETENIVRVLRTSNFTNNGTINYDEVVFRNVDKKKVEQKALVYGDILVEKSGGTDNYPVGRVVFFDKADEIYITNNFTTVFRVKHNVILSKYLFLFLMFNYNRGGMKKYFNKTTGIQNLKVNNLLDELEVPIPPIEIQTKIVAVLDEAQKLIDKRKEQIERLDDLIESIFYDMFGDPVRNEKGWEVKKLGQLGKLERGKSKHRPRNDSMLYGGEYPFVQTGDVAAAGLFLYNYQETYSEAGLQQSKLWSPNTLCITIAANIANTTILKIDACFPDSIVGFISNQSSNIIYIRTWFLFLQKTIEESAPKSAQRNINLAILNNLDVIAPPIYLQNQFAEKVEQIEKQKAAMEQSLKLMQDNYHSLMQRAFKGELF